MEIAPKYHDLAPCGIYCGICPSFEKTCKGCASMDTFQKRKSKWSCKIRRCCYENKKLDYCVYCADFPCKLLKTKLFKLSIGGYSYRYQIEEVFPKIKEMGVDKYREYLISHLKTPL